MNFSTNAPRSSLTRKENIPPASQTDAPRLQRANRRVALGVLSENEQHGQSASQGSQLSKPSPTSDSFFGHPSSSSYDVYVEEACEVVLAAWGQEVVSGSSNLDPEANALQNEDLVLLLELGSSLFQDLSMQSEDSLTSEEVPCVSEYTVEIHQHMREREVKFRPRPAYLENHPEITNDMRVILVDWLVEVAKDFKLRSETLHLAVKYLDHFLSRTASVKRARLQLVGTAALFVAAKYEEIIPPELNGFVYITDNTYTREQLLRMEHVFLKMLAFNLTIPTANMFLHLYMSIHNVCAITENLALYIVELSMLEIDPFLKYTPSMIAAGAYCLANYTVNKSLWPDSLRAFAGYTVDDIVSCFTDLHKLHIGAEARPQQAILEKYKSSKYCRVSSITPPAVLTSS